jgi:predicted RNA polymerase sigma factor
MAPASPVADINCAVAAAMRAGLEAGLALFDAILLRNAPSQL